MTEVHEFDESFQKEIYNMKFKEVIEIIKKHPNMKEKELSLFNLIDWVRLYKGDNADIFKGTDQTRFNLLWHEALDAIAFKVYMELYETEKTNKGKVQ